MMDRVIIGFGHKRRRGKDKAAEFASKRMRLLDVPHRIDSFASSIKEGIGRGVFGFDDAQLYGELKTVEDPFWGITPRDVFQRFGTEVMHTQFGKDVWVRTLQRRAVSDPASILITDVRFLHEAQALQKMGATLVRVDRDVVRVEEEDGHASETSLDNFDGWDAVIDNNDSLGRLREAVDLIVNSVLEYAGVAAALR